MSSNNTHYVAYVTLKRVDKIEVPAVANRTSPVPPTEKRTVTDLGIISGLKDSDMEMLKKKLIAHIDLFEDAGIIDEAPRQGTRSDD